MSVARNLPFLMDLARGNVSHMWRENIVGENPVISLATDPEDVWDYSASRTYTAPGGAALFISSSAGADTQEVLVHVLVENASAEWILETLTVTLVGQAKTAIPVASGLLPVRVLKVENNDSSDFAGDVYVYEDDTLALGVPTTPAKVRAKVRIGNNKTLMAMYTIPSNRQGFLTRFVARTSSTIDPQKVPSPGYTYAKLPIVAIYIREFGGVWKCLTRGAISSMGSSNWEEDLTAIPLLPAKTDIKWTVDEVGDNNCSVVCGFDIVMQVAPVT
ncbi:MAG: hypothetical protein U9Q07_04325 [Planctomycetota bacterium]|nr:hypothetical protein [Planctomycetota bacterium]